MIGRNQKLEILCQKRLDADKKSELENYAMIEILESLPEKIQSRLSRHIWDEFLS